MDTETESSGIQQRRFVLIGSPGIAVGTNLMGLVYRWDVYDRKRFPKVTVTRTVGSESIRTIELGNKDHYIRLHLFASDQIPLKKYLQAWSSDGSIVHNVEQPDNRLDLGPGRPDFGKGHWVAYEMQAGQK